MKHNHDAFLYLYLFSMISKEEVFSIQNENEFNQVALKVFHYQIQNNAVYRQYVNHFRKNVAEISHYTDIPFLPIQFFKTKNISTLDIAPATTFTSSGTTGMINSRHLVYDVEWYEKSYRKTFKQFYGNIEDITILALLPSYLEREGSSLIYMVDDLIKSSRQAESNYFLYNHKELFHTLKQLKSTGKKTILIGVTYALLDFLENYQIDFPELIVMETGGMKGKRKEMIREELHQILCSGFGVDAIHSEYGMTELLSQGYSYGKGLFKTPAWMKILIRDTNDPLTLLKNSQTGALNIIDLANIHSCAFIATQDLGKIYKDQSFEILGRFDNADIRGCNLLVQ